MGDGWLVTHILGWWGLKFIPTQGPFFQGEIIHVTRGDNNKIAKIQWQNFKNLLLQNRWDNFNQTWHNAPLIEGDSNLFKWRTIKFSWSKWWVFFFSYSTLWYNHMNCFLRWAMWRMNPLLKNHRITYRCIKKTYTCISIPYSMNSSFVFTKMFLLI